MNDDEIKIEDEGEENFEQKIKKVKEELKKCQKEKDEYLAGWQRAKADFINTKKDEEKNRAEFAKFSNQIIISDILLVLDSFDLALKDCEMKNHNDEKSVKLAKGFYLIKSQLDDILKKHGLAVIKALGDKFNPEFHEAIAEADLKECETGIIVEEFQRGYTLYGKVLRPAKVKITK
ncbi:MAG: nucleotide exchange factor GrpE [bacterium]|nr:nucleotide exchange factor GrpE [bacterium]